jgi:hypothetical protein
LVCNKYYSYHKSVKAKEFTYGCCPFCADSSWVVDRVILIARGSNFEDSNLTFPSPQTVLIIKKVFITDSRTLCKCNYIIYWGFRSYYRHLTLHKLLLMNIVNFIIKVDSCGKKYFFSSLYLNFKYSNNNLFYDIGGSKMTYRNFHCWCWSSLCCQLFASFGDGLKKIVFN